MIKNIIIPESYEIVDHHYIEELHSDAFLLKHKKSSARVAVLSNDDENKVFQVAFRTPPKDSTGVAHITEHSVLCGSDEFPVKDPFVELVKGSLNTFLNAMTYSDKTVYPVASCNDADFQNLMHIYLDAVFHPHIYRHKEIFLQEGWHYELADKDSPLIYNGVVYNEMKGAFSSPEQVLFRKIQQTLFPDTTYGVESGGDPDYIPDLTYEQFLDFHKKYYHPSNAWLYLYGDMDVEEKLTFIDKHYLSTYDTIDVDSEVSVQQPFTEMKTVEASFAVTDEDAMKANTYLAYNVVMGSTLDAEEYLAMQILDYVLMSSTGAVLKKKLIESGLGKDVMGSLENGILQPYYSIIIKNAEPEDKDKFIALIRENLEMLVREGISREKLRAAINYYEFKYREGDFGRFPAGLMYGLQMMDSWLYEETKPFIHIQSGAIYEALKEKVGTGYFERLIDEWFLKNPHGSILILKPEKGLTEKTEEALKAVLQKKKEAMSETEIEEMVAATAALKAYQAEPSPKEELDKIPVLGIEDISPDPKPVFNRFEKIAGRSVLWHDIESNGIIYIRWLFNLGSVPFKQIPYISLLSSVFSMVDTEKYSYGTLSDEINMHTGGIRTTTCVYSEYGNINRYYPRFETFVKVMPNELEAGISLMAEILFSSKLDDKKRLKEIIGILKSRYQMMMSGNGHTMSVNRSFSYHSAPSAYKEMLDGIAFYRFIESIDQSFEEKSDEILANLKEVAALIFKKENLMIDVTCKGMDEDAIIAVMDRILTESMPKGNEISEEEIRDRDKIGVLTQVDADIRSYMKTMKNEIFTTAGTVQYAACTGNFIEAGFKYHGALNVLKVMMNYDYLWNKLRVQGGAYGCMSGFTSGGGGYFVSYRDPNLKATYEVYQEAEEYVKNFDTDEITMRKYIIGAISGVDVPLTAADNGNYSLNVYMTHTDYEQLKQNRKELLGTTAETIRSLHGIVGSIVESNYRCAVSSVVKANEEGELFDHNESLFH